MVAGLPDGPAERLIDATLGRADEMDLPSGVGSELRTFVFADIRGYTAFTQHRGDEAAEILTATFASTTRDAAAEYDGMFSNCAETRRCAFSCRPVSRCGSRSRCSSGSSG